MKKYIYIGLGGFFGAVLRFYVKNIDIQRYSGEFPLNTILINITGCFVLSLVLTLAEDSKRLSRNLILCITTGFLGAFTTFSTLCRETTLLFISGNQYYSIGYVLLSIILGFGAAGLGTQTASVIKRSSVR